LVTCIVVSWKKKKKKKKEKKKSTTKMMKSTSNCAFLTLFRMKELGVELANEMDDSSLFVREILQVLLILEMLYGRKTLVRTLKRLHILQRKHTTNRMLLGNKFKRMSHWQNQ